MLDDTPPANATWLRVLLVLELLWWLGASGLCILFLVVASTFGSPDAPMLAAMLALSQGACFVSIGVIAAGLFRRPQSAPAQRFAAIHGTVATTAAVPVAVWLVVVASISPSTGASEIAGLLVAAVLMIAVPLSAALLARSSRRIASRIGVGLCAITCPAAATVLLAIMASLAVSGGLTV